MGKIKDFIIEALGGHTESEWQSTLRLYRCMPEEITYLDLVCVGASTHMNLWEWNRLEPEAREKIIKSQIKNVLAYDLDQFIEYKVLKSVPPYDTVTVFGKMRALRPESGGVFHYVRP